MALPFSPSAGSPARGSTGQCAPRRDRVQPPADVPKSRLKLSWAYGYRGFDTRQNAFYNAKGELVYHTAAVGVVYNPIYETQKHITDDPESDDIAEGNTDDIVSMARHPDKTTFATGEIGRKPKIVVWSSDDVMRMAAEVTQPSSTHRGSPTADSSGSEWKLEWHQASDSQGNSSTHP